MAASLALISGWTRAHNTVSGSSFRVDFGGTFCISYPVEKLCCGLRVSQDGVLQEFWAKARDMAALSVIGPSFVRTVRESGCVLFSESASVEDTALEWQVADAPYWV